MSLLIPVSAGELMDKITILQVKAERIGDAAKEANVRKELALLEAVAAQALGVIVQLAGRKHQRQTAVGGHGVHGHALAARSAGRALKHGCSCGVHRSP